MKTLRNAIRQMAKELQSLWHEVAVVGGPDQAYNLMLAIIAWAVASLTWIEGQIEQIEMAYIEHFELWTSRRFPVGRKPFEVFYGVGAYRLAMIGATLAIFLECFLAAVLAAQTLNLGLIVAMVVGIVLTLAVTFTFKGVLGQIFARYHDRPKQAMHILNILMLIVFPAEALLLVTAFFVSRSSGDSVVAQVVFAPVMSVLSIITPLIAATLLVGAEYYGWSKELSSIYVQLQKIERDVQAIKAYAERRRDELTKATPTNGGKTADALPAPTTPAPNPTTTPTTMVSPNPTAAGAPADQPKAINGTPAPPATPETTAPPNATAAPNTAPAGAANHIQANNGNTPGPDQSEIKVLLKRLMEMLEKTAVIIILTGAACFFFGSPAYAQGLVDAQLWHDNSGSVDRLEWQAGADAFAREIPTLTERFRVRDWKFYRFNADSWSVAPFFNLEMPAFEVPQCNAVAGELTSLFKAFKKRAETDCRQLRNAASENFKSSLATQFARATRQAREFVGPAGNCTSVIDLFTRVSLLNRPTMVAIISDGIETCRSQTLIKPVPAPKPYVRVVMILISSNDRKDRETPAEHFEVQKQRLVRIVPWMTIVPPASFSTDLFYADTSDGTTPTRLVQSVGRP